MFKTEDKISIEPAEMIEMSEWQAEKLSSTVIFALWGFDLYIFRRFCGKLNSKCRFHAEQNRDCLLACLSRFFYSSIAVYSWSEKSTKNANIYTFPLQSRGLPNEWRRGGSEWNGTAELVCCGCWRRTKRANATEMMMMIEWSSIRFCSCSFSSWESES